MKKQLLITLLFLFYLASNAKAQYYVSTLSGYTFYIWSPDPTSFKSIEPGFNRYLTKSGNYWYLSWNGGGFAGGVTHRSPATCSLTPPCTAIWEKNTTAPSLYTYHPWVGPSGTETINITTGGAYKCSSGTLGTRAYVDLAAIGANDGTTWANAFKSLESALEAARTCGVTEIWVAKGTYKPSNYPKNITGSPALTTRDYTFHLVDGVKIYGGFDGTETTLASRTSGNETVLSGDLNSDDPNDSENCHHIVTSINDTAATLLEGFTITGGNSMPGSAGGSITVEGKTLNRNQGAGIYVINGSIEIEKVILEKNKAQFGGGMYNFESDVKIKESIFYTNFAFGGGGIYNSSSSPMIENTIFAENSAFYGGAIINIETSGAVLSKPSINLCTFHKNTSAMMPPEGGILNYSNSSSIVSNSIFWQSGSGVLDSGSGVSTVTYSNLPSFTTSAGNTNSDPQFISETDLDGTDDIWRTADDGLKLKNSSPAINASDLSVTTPTTDITSFTRFLTFDMGAYEYNSCLYTFTAGRVYVDQAATGLNNGSTWANAFTDLQTALEASRTCPVTEIWVAKGTYKPSKDIGGNLVAAPFFNATFLINNNVKIYGGFLSGHLLLTDRNPELNPTILSGDLGTVGFKNDNSFSVLTINGTSSASRLDGFTISDGYSQYLGASAIYNGAGIKMVDANTKINDCKFINNQADGGGGAIYIETVGTSIVGITNCYFKQNTALGNGYVLIPSSINSGGGAIKLFGIGTSSLINANIENCVFENNLSKLGGAINSTGNMAIPSIRNSVFVENKAIASGGLFGLGGAVYSKNIPNIHNSTFYKNIATTNGNSVFNEGNTYINISNSIFWGSTNEIHTDSSLPNITYCNIEGGYPGTGNINADPLFVNILDLDGTDNIWRTTDDGLNITNISPAINSGDPASLASPPYDITNRTRVPVFDMGAYEGGCMGLAAPTVTFSTGFRPQGNINLNCVPNVTVTNPTVFDIEVIQFGDGPFTVPASGSSTILPSTSSRAIYQLRYANNPSCTYEYFTLYGNGSSPSYTEFYDFRNGYIRKVNSAPSVVIGSPYAIVTPNPSGICAGNNLNLKVISDSYGDWISSLQVFDGNTITNLSSQLTPNTNAPQNINMGVLNSNKTLIFRTLTVDFEYLFSGSGVPMFEISCPNNVTISPAPCVQPVATISGTGLPSGMFISICNGSTILQTAPYSGGPIALNAISGAGTYTIVLHQTPGGSCSPSIPSGFSFGSESIGTFSDTNINGRLTFTFDATGNVVGSPSRINADNDIVFNLISSTPLPIKLVSFDAKAYENQVQLIWKTSSETNSAGFEVERSDNGKEFTKIGYVKSEASAGNSLEALEYNFTDSEIRNLKSQILFYRLKQVDLDGKFTYSAIKSVKMESEGAVKVFPNPTSDFIYIETNSVSKIKNIQLVNAKGSVIYRSNLQENKIDISSQPTGIYFLKIEELSGRITIKKVLKN
jgi:predicted outer membrane repeat protein